MKFSQEIQTSLKLYLEKTIKITKINFVNNFYIYFELYILK